MKHFCVEGTAPADLRTMNVHEPICVTCLQVVQYTWKEVKLILHGIAFAA